jgi:lipopolysaccharide/colanic/teichoic acid biosynthesis glycosyltransferase
MSATELEASQVAPNRAGATGVDSHWVAGACRALDIVLSAVLIVVLAPVFALIALAVRLDSPGRVIYRQLRIGRKLESFTMLKFRSMRSDASHERHREYVVGLISGTVPDPGAENTMYKLTQDDRITKIGRLLRRSSLDELPQIWNVLRGEMSLVGPRPPLGYEVEHYPAHWFGRFAVKPGLTGLWQVSGRCELTVEEMIALDLEYVRRRSLWLNVKILARTVPVVFLGRGAA